MGLHGLRGLDARGFSAAELIIALAVVGSVAAMSLPTLVTYYQPPSTESAARDLASALNRARELSIAQNRYVCFQAAGNQYRYTYGCGGPAVILPGADADGSFRLADNAIVTTSGVNPVFDYLGAAPTPATLTVTYVGLDTQAVERNVVVSRSGRIQIQ